MIARIAKTPLSTLRQAADFVLSNVTYANDVFPHCSDLEALLSELRKSREAWSVLSLDQAAAFFRLRLSDTEAIIDKFLPSQALPIEALVRNLRQDLEKLKVKSLILDLSEEFTESLTRNGFQKQRSLTRLSGPVTETKLMPILPLNSPTDGDIPALAMLMHASYEKSSERKMPNPASAENLLRAIMAGALGHYVAEASFMSGAIQNVVSACFVTLSSPREANVTQLFTHPLYRARGLATSEVATSMNKLAKTDVQTLTLWIDEANEVARRLFTKLGFKQDRRLVEMRTDIP